MTAVIGAECRGCGACLLTCPVHAVRPGARWQTSPLLVLTDLCNDCGECVEICPADAIEVTPWLPPAL